MHSIFHNLKICLKNLARFNWIMTLCFRNKYLLFIAAVFFVLVSYEQLNHHATMQYHQSISLNHELKQIQETLNEIVNISMSNQQQTIRDKTNKSFSLLQQTLIELESQISATQENMNAHFKIIHEALVDKKEDKPYMDANVLPFHVISVDMMEDQAFVSIDYGNHTTPLQVGEWIGGWQVFKLNVDSAAVEFVNANKQYVKVRLKEPTVHG